MGEMRCENVPFRDFPFITGPSDSAAWQTIKHKISRGDISSSSDGSSFERAVEQLKSANLPRSA